MPDVLSSGSLSGPLVLVSRGGEGTMKPGGFLFTWHICPGSDARVGYRQGLPTDGPCAGEEGELEHRDASTEQSKAAARLQSLSEVCRRDFLNAPSNGNNPAPRLRDAGQGPRRVRGSYFWFLCFHAFCAELSELFCSSL